MSLYKLNGVEVDIDMEDYEFQQKYEKAFSQMDKEEKEIQKTGKLSEITKAYCNMFYHLFDNLFGEGFGEKLFKGKFNTRVVEETYEEFLNICKEQIITSNKRKANITNKYAVNKPNREQRRSKNKGKK